MQTGDNARLAFTNRAFRGAGSVAFLVARLKQCISQAGCLYIVTFGKRPHLPRLGADASRRGPDEDIPRGRDQTKNAVAATSRDRTRPAGRSSGTRSPS